LGFVLVVVLAVALLALRGKNHTLRLENRSGERITELHITIAGDTKQFHDVANGRDVSVPCAAANEESVAVEGRLSDGTQIKARGTFPMPARLIVVPHGEIKIQQGQ
jgi:hypothetical protein